MRARKPVVFREKSRNPCIDQWALLSPDADPCSDNEDRAERAKRVEQYAKQAKKKQPLHYKGADDGSQ